MKISIEQKLFPLPYNTIDIIKTALNASAYAEIEHLDYDQSYREKINQLSMCIDSIGKDINDEPITGYHNVSKFDEENDIEIIIRLKERKK